MRSKDRKKIYNSKRWKTVRLQALIRDNFMCVICKAENKETVAKEVDHIKELKDRPDLAYDLDNLQSTCRSCHFKKTRAERYKRGNK